MSVTIFYEEKTPFWVIKPKRGWSRGVDSWFGPNMAVFSTFFFRQYRQGKCLSRYSRTKKLHSRLKEQEIQKVKTLTFFQRG